jgi:fructokinase
MTREAKTGVTFVTLDAEGERSFMFFREPSADYTIRAEDIDEGWMRRSDIFLYGSNLLNERGSRDATLVAIDAARTAGCLLISDPNVRDHLWEDMEEARARMLDSLDGAHIVKVNERELEFFAPSMGLEEAYGEVFAPLGVRALVHTRSAGGAELLFDDLLHVEVEAPPIEKVVDTTGAGDAFIAGLTTGLVRMAAERELLRGGAHGYLSMLDAFDHGDWERVLRLGCLVGTTTCKEYGATPALPDIEEIPWGALGFEPPERRSPASS